MEHVKLISGALLCVCAVTVTSAQELSLKDCALDAIPNTPHSIVSAADGNSYFKLSDDCSRVERYDYKTGELISVVMDSEKLRDCNVNYWEGYIVSPNEKLLLLYTDSEPIYRNSFKASYYIYDIARNNIKPLSENGAQEIPVFSPDSRMIAFARDNNVYVAKIDYGTELPVTKDGEKNKIINGTPDWVYQEEFGIVSSLTWSPDNSMLAFIRWDESKVPMYSLPLYKGVCEPKDEYTYYPGEFKYKYPVAGETNSTVSVLSYDVETRALKTMNIPLETNGYVNKIEFGKSADRLMVNTLNRNQNKMQLYAVNPRSAMAKLIYTDESDSWIEPSITSMTKYYDNFFVVASARSGYTHLYQYSNAGSLMRQITKGNWNVTDFYGYDPVKKYFYYQSTEEGPLNRTLSRINAKGKHERLSMAQGTNSAEFNADLSYYILKFSDVKTPTQYALYNAKGKKVRDIEMNKDYSDKYLGGMPEKEFITVESDSFILNGYMIKPRNFDASKKYPVIMYQYSGPGSQLVLNEWDLDWLHYAACEGYLIVCVDGRGTGGRDKEFTSVVYKNLGHYESIDQVAVANYLRSLPYVDAKAIGIFGWSYGGYETLMAMTQEGAPFAAGVAVAPVTDWRFYDSIYTERFMQTPQQNENGYESSSVLSRIEKLKGDLLIITGTVDDNVHPQNTYELVAKIHALGMTDQLDMMLFPNMNHSINGCDVRYTLYKKILDYFNEKLK